jgi:hypothetical protein
VAELVGEAGVVVAVAGVKVAAEAACDLVGRPVTEVVAAKGGRSLQVRQQFRAVLLGVADGCLSSLRQLGGIDQSTPLGVSGKGPARPCSRPSLSLCWLEGSRTLPDPAHRGSVTAHLD